MGFLRLATNRKIVGESALVMAEAWQRYNTLNADERVVFADEPSDLEPVWRKSTQRTSHSVNVWTDAYLAAFAIEGDLQIVTFDRGFTQFRDLQLTLLEA